METLKLTATERTVQRVEVTDKVNGNEQTVWEIREMVASDRDKYLTDFNKRFRFDSDGRPVGMSNFEGMHWELLGRCMYRIEAPNPEHNDKPILRRQLDRWPVSVQAALYEAANNVNKIKKLDTEGGDEKNV